MTSSDHTSHGGKKRKRKESGEGSLDYPDVALEQLQMNTLRRYKRHFKLQMRPCPTNTKVQLLDSINRHFRSIHVSEKESLAYFIYMVKMKKNKVDKDGASPSDDEKKDTKSER